MARASAAAWTRASSVACSRSPGQLCLGGLDAGLHGLAQLVTFPARVGPHLVEHPGRFLVCPVGVGPGGIRARLGCGGPLPGGPGGLLVLVRLLPCLVTVGLGSPDEGLGLGLCLADHLPDLPLSGSDTGVSGPDGLSNAGLCVFLRRLDRPGRLVAGALQLRLVPGSTRLEVRTCCVGVSAGLLGVGLGRFDLPRHLPGQPGGLLCALLCSQPGRLLPVSGAPRGIPLILGVADLR